METDLSLPETLKEWHGSAKAYAIGFILCIVLTAASFGLVMMDVLSGKELIYTLIGLAIVQAIVQAIFFLHLGQEDKPRWETASFSFMVAVLLIIAIGSLWVMNDLNERMMGDMSKEMTHD